MDAGYFAGAPPATAAQAAAAAGPPGRPPAAAGGRPSARGPLRRLLVAVLLAGVAVAGLAAHAGQADPPPALHSVSEPAPAGAGWTAEYVDDAGRPARWDPCRPVHYVVQGGWLPPEGRADLAEALRRLSAASGLRFVDDGDTGEQPGRARAAYQPDRYGARWAPVLIGWVPPASTDLPLGGGVAGITSAVAVPGRDGGSIVTAQVAIDASHPLHAGFGPGQTDGEVLLHELAHMVGLGHVADPTQVMYTTTTDAESQYGAGDRAGLAALGAPAGCHPAPPPRALRTSG